MPGWFGEGSNRSVDDSESTSKVVQQSREVLQLPISSENSVKRSSPPLPPATEQTTKKEDVYKRTSIKDTAESTAFGSLLESSFVSTIETRGGTSPAVTSRLESQIESSSAANEQKITSTTQVSSPLQSTAASEEPSSQVQSKAAESLISTPLNTVDSSEPDSSTPVQTATSPIIDKSTASSIGKDYMSLTSAVPSPSTSVSVSSHQVSPTTKMKSTLSSPYSSSSPIPSLTLSFSESLRSSSLSTDDAKTSSKPSSTISGTSTTSRSSGSGSASPSASSSSIRTSLLSSRQASESTASPSTTSGLLSPFDESSAIPSSTRTRRSTRTIKTYHSTSIIDVSQFRAATFHTRSIVHNSELLSSDFMSLASSTSQQHSSYYHQTSSPLTTRGLTTIVDATTESDLEPTATIKFATETSWSRRSSSSSGSIISTTTIGGMAFAGKAEHPTPAPTPESYGGGKSMTPAQRTGTIAGSVVGGIVLVAIALGFIVFRRHQRQRRAFLGDDDEDDENYEDGADGNESGQTGYSNFMAPRFGFLRGGNGTSSNTNGPNTIGAGNAHGDAVSEFGSRTRLHNKLFKSSSSNFRNLSAAGGNRPSEEPMSEVYNSQTLSHSLFRPLSNTLGEPIATIRAVIPPGNRASIQSSSHRSHYTSEDDEEFYDADNDEQVLYSQNTRYSPFSDPLHPYQYAQPGQDVQSRFTETGSL